MYSNKCHRTRLRRTRISRQTWCATESDRIAGNESSVNDADLPAAPGGTSSPAFEHKFGRNHAGMRWSPGRKSERGRGYADSSIHSWRALLHLVLADAEENGLIGLNVAAKRKGRGKRTGLPATGARSAADRRAGRPAGGPRR